MHFVGLGSNLLVRDGGLRGTVVFTHWALREIALGALADAEGEVRADAGVATPKSRGSRPCTISCEANSSPGFRAR